MERGWIDRVRYLEYRIKNYPQWRWAAAFFLVALTQALDGESRNFRVNDLIFKKLVQWKEKKRKEASDDGHTKKFIV